MFREVHSQLPTRPQWRSREHGQDWHDDGAHGHGADGDDDLADDDDGGGDTQLVNCLADGDINCVDESVSMITSIISIISIFLMVMLMPVLMFMMMTTMATMSQMRCCHSDVRVALPDVASRTSRCSVFQGG